MRMVAGTVAVLVLGAPAIAQHARQISQSGFGAYEASVAALNDGFAVAWYDTRDGHPEIYLRLLDSKGNPAGNEWRLTGGQAAAYEADISAVGENVAVAWYERGLTSEYRAMLAIWTRAGSRLWVKTLSAADRYGRNPVVRAGKAGIFCAWLEYAAGTHPDVHAQWFDFDGRPLGPPQRLGPAGRTTWNLNAAIDDRGRAWVVFDANAGTRREELFLARVEKSRSHLVRLTADDGQPSKYPDVAIAKGRVALTWFDERDGNEEVYLFVAPAAEVKEGLERRAVRVTRTAGESIGAYVAWNGSRVGLAWCDNSEGQHEIYFEPFTRDGVAVGAPRRLTHNDTQSLIPALRPVGDGFAIAWNEFTPGPAGGHDANSRSEVVFALVN